jgi:hypothetical protein
MSVYHYQCMYCFCTTGMWTEDDGLDQEHGGAVSDCGCQSDNDWDDD